MARKRYHMIVKESCPYCQKAKELLDVKGLCYSTDPMDEKPELLLEIQKESGFNTVPMIWEIGHGGARKFIGGYAELLQYFMSTEKKKLLRD
jgi:glutaredoxin